jgi:hypothetical protein
MVMSMVGSVVAPTAGFAASTADVGVGSADARSSADDRPSAATPAQTTASDYVDCHLNDSCPTTNESLDVSGQGVNVLVDLTKGGASLTAYTDVLLDRGFEVDAKRSTSGGLTEWEGMPTEGLSDYDAVLIPKPEEAYSDAELEALHEYVQNGGSLMVIGDWTDPLRGDAAKLNAITDRYGLHFNGETNRSLRNIQDPTNKTVEDYEWRVLLHNTVEFPINEGVDRVEYDGVSVNVTDTENGTQVPLLYGDDDTYEFTYSTTEERFRENESELIYGAGAAWDIGDNGRVLAFGSQKSLTTYLTEEWQNEHVETDTREFLVRSMKWLAGAGSLERPDGPVAVRGERVKGGEVPANESIVLKNSKIATAIGTESQGPFGALPGGIYDGAAYGLSTDSVGVFEFAANGFGSWPAYEEFTIENASDDRAVVTATGQLQEFPNVEVTTRYVLARGAEHVWMNTTLTNTGDAALPTNESERLLSGAALSTEGQSVWLPGRGEITADDFSYPPASSLADDWVATWGPRVTYGSWGAGDDFSTFEVSSTFVDIWRRNTLDSGETDSFNYTFQVSGGADVSEVNTYKAEREGDALGSLAGNVTSTEGEPVAFPEVAVAEGDEPLVFTTGREDGEYNLSLEPGTYTVGATASGYSDSERRNVTITANETSSLSFDSLEGPAPVNATVYLEDENGTEPTDARILVRDEGGAVVRTIYTDSTDVGNASFRLAPGNYTLQFHHGTEYIANPVSENISVEPGEGVAVTATLTEELDPSERDWVGADLHAHSGVSFDGSTPVEDFVGIQLSSGVDLVMLSDHNAIGGWDTVAAQADNRSAAFIRSEEITTGDLGHFNPYPMHGETVIPANGTILDFIQEARAEHNASVFQINHPDDRFTDLTEEEREYLRETDAIEAYNGEYGPEDEASVQGLFNLWNQGFRISATGVSDDHCADCLGTLYGSARTRAYLPGNVTPDRYANAVDDMRAYATYGPAVEFTVDGEFSGANVTTDDGSVNVSARVENLDDLAYANVITNGSVARNVTLDGTTAEISEDVEVSGNGWIALRVVDSEGDRALTNPVWVSTGDGAEDDGAEDGNETETPDEPETGAPTASVSFANQTSDGTTVTVESVTMAEGGFVAIHNASGPVIGVSEFLSAGTHEDVEVTLFDVPDQNVAEGMALEESGTLIAMAHLDTDGDRVYDFVASNGSEDGPYTANDSAVVDSAFVTVEDEADEDDQAADDDEADDAENDTGYYQIDFVRGEPIESLDWPDGTYTNDQLIRFAHGSTEDPVTRRSEGEFTTDAALAERIDSRNITVANSTATITFTVADGESVTLSLASYIKPDPTWDPEDEDDQVFVDAQTETYESGTHTLTVDLPGEGATKADEADADDDGTDDGNASDGAPTLTVPSDSGIRAAAKDDNSMRLVTLIEQRQARP